jgi:hypothetical protein
MAIGRCEVCRYKPSIKASKPINALRGFEKIGELRLRLNGSFVMTGLIRVAVHQSSLSAKPAGHTDIRLAEMCNFTVFLRYKIHLDEFDASMNFVF